MFVDDCLLFSKATLSSVRVQLHFWPSQVNHRIFVDDCRLIDRTLHMNGIDEKNIWEPHCFLVKPKSENLSLQLTEDVETRVCCWTTQIQHLVNSVKYSKWKFFLTKMLYWPRDVTPPTPPRRDRPRDVTPGQYSSSLFLVWKTLNQMDNCRVIIGRATKLIHQSLRKIVQT